MKTTVHIPNSQTRHLNLDHGRIGYDLIGAGPLVVMVPGVGDLRAEYRFVAAALAAAGYAVATMDLRGHGDSDATFPRFDGASVADDIVALIRHLKLGPAAVVGTSLAAGAALVASVVGPDCVRRLVFAGGFTRDPNVGLPMRLLLRMLMGGPWRVAVWMAVHERLFPLRKPDDHQSHRDAMRASLSRRAYSAAFGEMMLSSHAYAHERYGDVCVPSLFVMGTADSDFEDPVREATEVADALCGETLLIDGAGHYPHVEAPEQFLAGVLPFLNADAGAPADASY